MFDFAYCIALIRLLLYYINSHNIYYILLFQIEDLQMSLSRQEKENSRREDLLRQEVSDMQIVSSTIYENDEKIYFS